jgi:hypothetical protein
MVLNDGLDGGLNDDMDDVLTTFEIARILVD